MNAKQPVVGDRPLTIQVERRERAAVVRLSGSASMEVSSQIQHCLVGLASEGVPIIAVDMSELDFIDSTGLGGIVAAHLKARHTRGSVRLVNPRPSIRQELVLTRLTQLFPIFRNVEQALSAPGE